MKWMKMNECWMNKEVISTKYWSNTTEARQY